MRTAIILALALVYSAGMAATVRVVEPEAKLLEAKAQHSLTVLDLTDWNELEDLQREVHRETDHYGDRPEVILLSAPDSACDDEIDCVVAMRLACGAIGEKVDVIDFDRNAGTCDAECSDGSTSTAVCPKPR
jgi:hypothetical protein